MKNLLFTTFLVFSLGLSGQDYTTDHFQFYTYNNVALTDIYDIADSLEENYPIIIDDLSISNLPTTVVKVWDNYPDFLDTMEFYLGQAYNGATGYVLPNTIMLYDGYGSAHTFAAHEFAHIASLHINPSIGNNPRWLWEAVAQYFGHHFYNPANLYYINNGNYPTLQELNADFSSANGGMIYDLGFVIIKFIVQQWNMNKVIELIENNGNIQASFSISETEFESMLYQYIETEYMGNYVEENKREEISIYPNPTKNNLYLKVPKSIKYGTVAIYNALGMQIYKEDMLKEELRIDISQWQNGVYTFVLENDGSLTQKKVLIVN